MTGTFYGDGEAEARAQFDRWAKAEKRSRIEFVSIRHPDPDRLWAWEVEFTIESRDAEPAALELGL